MKQLSLGIPPQPQLFLQKLADPFPQVVAGQLVRFVINFANSGSVPVKNVRVVDNFPPTMQFVTSTPAPTSVTNGQYSWTIGSLSP
jgi:uncharacterized repeat protein (TIGR01451 family)